MIDTLVRDLRQSPMLVVAFAIVGAYLVVALFAPALAPRDPNVQHLSATLRPPLGAYLLGSDEYGRDLLSRLIFGARSSMLVGAAVVLLSAAIGTVLGMIAGFWGGVIDDLLMRTSDVMMAFPSLVLALGLIAALGPGLQSTIIALTVSFTPIYARVVRGSVLSIKQEAYVEAAKAIGVREPAIIVRHVVPNAMGPILVQGSLTFAFAVLSEAGLSFVGLGVPPPTASFGNIIASGRDYIIQASWITTFSGLATVLIVLALLVIADGLRDAVDPYQHRL